jgi:hypothetical protein
MCQHTWIASLLEHIYSSHAEGVVAVSVLDYQFGQLLLVLCILQSLDEVPASSRMSCPAEKVLLIVFVILAKEEVEGEVSPINMSVVLMTKQD